MKEEEYVFDNSWFKSLEDIHKYAPTSNECDKKWDMKNWWSSKKPPINGNWPYEIGYFLLIDAPE